eukprot:CAMPEP_0119278220 /NCGR_PEP_ID=MMETSP1329-20130426/18710_1 /TAXON_ID=114041 /ORGANISM="Genus nov. species nov., Strain RCC1024" /LENGTH=316 /DNA_ID=CAMNT_0007278723 /DNA_START=112 /DNA_END=1058 /DNA_ORIENTATION=-
MASFISPITEESAAYQYVQAFGDDSGKTFFCEYLSIDPATKQLDGALYTRKAFMKLALRGAAVLAEAGLEKGDRCVHYFSDNRFEDLVFRLSAVLTGTVPVTVNWQADSLERSAYKVRATAARLCLVDEGTPEAFAAAAAPAVVVDAAEALAEQLEPLGFDEVCGATRKADDRIVIFTSGTTGNPKGVQLSYGAYDCNRATFEQFLDCADPAVALDAVVTNPFHHTNSTAITDWLTRRPEASIRLLQRYTTSYWGCVVAAAAGVGCGEFQKLKAPDVGPVVARKVKAMAEGARQRVVCPLVSRHVDFLEDLCARGA